MFSEEDGMNILLAGGAGFIGTWVARIATAMGHTVTVVDDLSGAAGFNVKWLDSHKVPRVCASIDAYLQKGILENYDVVINLACRKMAACNANMDAFDVNANQAAMLARAAAQADVPLYIHISTGSVYGPKLAADRVTELSAPDPCSLYALTKFAGERLTEAALANTPYTKLFTLRLFNVMGPGQAYGPGGGVLARWCAGLVGLDTPPEVYGTGLQTRHITDVRDVAWAILRTLEWDLDDHPHHTLLNIASGQEVALNTVIDELQGCCSWDTEFAYRDDKPSGVERVLCDSSKSIQLGITYPTQWRATVRDALLFYKELANAPH